MNDRLVGHHDRKMDGNLDGNRGLRMNGTDDRNDLMTDANLAANLCHRMNDLLGGLMTDVNLCHRMNDLLDDQNSDVMTDASRDHRMNDLMGDRMTDENRVNRSCVRRDPKMGVNLDVNRDLRMSDLLGDPNLVVKMDAMSRHVKSMVFPNRNCDRMSHDHLRYDRQTMRHRDTNRMDGMILDGTMKIHHDCRPKKDARTHLNRESHLMMVCLMKI